MFIIFLLYQGGHVHHRFLQEFHLEQSCKHQILFGDTEETKAKGQSRLIRHRRRLKIALCPSPDRLPRDPDLREMTHVY